MKKYVRASHDFEACKDAARSAADQLWYFQNLLVGDPAYSEPLSPDDIDLLDSARLVLDKYAE